MEGRCPEAARQITLNPPPIDKTTLLIHTSDDMVNLDFGCMDNYSKFIHLQSKICIFLSFEKIMQFKIELTTSFDHNSVCKAGHGFVGSASAN